LLFPVKPRGIERRLILQVFAGFGAIAGLGPVAGFACGYSPVLGPGATGGLGVRLAQSLVAEPLVDREIVTGAETYLASLGALDDASTSVLQIAVVRLDETPAALRVAAPGPQASGISIRLTARGQVVTGGRVEASAELSRSVELSVRPGLALDRDAALGRVGRLVGRELAAHVVGLPTPERG